MAEALNEAVFPETITEAFREYCLSDEANVALLKEYKETCMVKTSNHPWCAHPLLNS